MESLECKHPGCNNPKRKGGRECVKCKNDLYKGRIRSKIQVAEDALDKMTLNYSLAIEELKQSKEEKEKLQTEYNKLRILYEELVDRLSCKDLSETFTNLLSITEKSSTNPYVEHPDD